MPEEVLPSTEAPPKPALVWPVGWWEWRTLAIQLGAAFAFGCLVALVYALTMRSSRRTSARPFLATLVLLSVLIAMVTLVIGNSLARAFGLVGALSIVRFRTVVQDTRDTAFVIFAVVVGMGAGAGYLAPPLLGMPLVFLAAWLFRPRKSQRDPRDAELTLRLRNTNPPVEAVRQVLERHLASYRQTAASTARGGAALDIAYLIQPRAADSYLALVTELLPLEGVQAVEVKES
ncbi:MAG: DUF4956 domain-containing protein [Gemmataceae bacterium]